MYNKKMVAILIVVLLLLTACTPQQTAPTTSTTGQTETTETAAPDSTVANTTETSQAEITTTVQETTVAQTTTVAEDDQQYPNAYLLDNIDNFVVDGDISQIEYFGELEYLDLDDVAENQYTGQLKKYNFNDEVIAQGVYIRFPQLVEDSELAATINEDIKTFAFESIDTEYLYFFEFDYDAYIYNDVLSIKLMKDAFHEGQDGMGKVVLKTYNFDISDGKLKLLSNREMLERIDVSLETIQDFAYQYLPDYLQAYCTEDEWLNIDDDISFAVESIANDFEEDELSIYKNDSNDYYGLALSYDFYYQNSGLLPSPSFTIADTTLKMALLSRPNDAIGLIYKAIEEEELPEKSITGKPIKLHVLNEPVATPVYITSFSKFDDSIDINDVQYGDVETADGVMLAELITSKGLPIENDPNFSNVYLYYAMLPETMPFDVVTMTGFTEELRQVRADNAIYDDMRFGSRIQYVFGTAIIAPYMKTLDEGAEARIEFKQDGTFEATGDYWVKYGFPITEGIYTSDQSAYYISPCQADIQAGADDFYVFSKLDFIRIKLSHGSVLGEIADGIVLELYQ